MHRAWDRITSFPTQRLQTRFGTIEYADHGDGLASFTVPTLVIHAKDDYLASYRFAA